MQFFCAKFTGSDITKALIKFILDFPTEKLILADSSSFNEVKNTNSDPMLGNFLSLFALIRYSTFFLSLQNFEHPFYF